MHFMWIDVGMAQFHLLTKPNSFKWNRMYYNGENISRVSNSDYYLLSYRDCLKMKASIFLFFLFQPTIHSVHF